MGVDCCYRVLPNCFHLFFFSILFRDPPGRRLSCSFAVTQPWPWPVVQGLRNNSSRPWLRWLAGSAGSSSSSSSSPAVPFFFLLFFFFLNLVLFFCCFSEAPPFSAVQSRGSSAAVSSSFLSVSLSLSLSLFWYFFSQFLISFCWIFFFGYVA